uniref:Sidekick cell adhesion molecule 2 n=1 Tax=Sus scrofa TaxID=9823 RepID=A0A8D0SYB5_PIG
MAATSRGQDQRHPPGLPDPVPGAALRGAEGLHAARHQQSRGQMGRAYPPVLRAEPEPAQPHAVRAGQLEQAPALRDTDERVQCSRRGPLEPPPGGLRRGGSAHGSAPQRGCPRCHGHTAGCDMGATPAGEPEWRHPGLQDFWEAQRRNLTERVKNSFCRKNGLYTRSPPRPSPGSLHYSDEDVAKYNDLIPAESSSLTEKPSEISDSQGSDSEYEVDSSHQKAHSFVNHYISDPTYYNSWRRQQKGISRAQAYSYTESDPGDPDHTPLSNSSSAQQGSLFRPKASRTPTPQNPPNPPSQQSTLYRPPSSLAPGSRAPIAGFSSFV